MKDVLVSIIIPVIKVNDFLRDETIPALLKQTFKDFEIIIVTDKISNEQFSKTKIIASWPRTGPADKRDLGVKKSKSEIIAFLDDDSYPEHDWLENALSIFKENQNIAGVCGPSLTPPQNNIRQKASGYVWSTWLGSGGAGTYRCAKSSRREVDDFPTVNLLVRKKDFNSVGGFDSHYWPGEDTKLCLDLTKKLGKKIIYDPGVVVYHHRREVFGPHLKQISRYAIHRGHFARIFPETSLRLGYLLPSFFVLGLFSIPIIFMFFPNSLLLFYSLVYTTSGLLLYLFHLFYTATGVYQKEKNIRLSGLVMLSIFITHLFYGILFIKGFFTPKLKK